ncbi:MAG: aldo/keto reductase [Pseudonocardiaceae bacterium]|nr:aldo/keto reductase [Pseudonocardiaceae bacterium]
MRYTTLGKSGLTVSPIAFGTWQLSGEWGGYTEDEAVRAINAALESGINFFDTAQAYGFGEAERMLGKALRGENRDELVIATKGGLRPDGNPRDSSREWLRKGVHQSLDALGIDVIDLYQVHWPDPATPFAETAETLRELIDEGKIRHVGVSNFDEREMAAFAEHLPLESLQPPYHLFNRDVEDGILSYAQESGIGVLVYGPLAHGMLTGSFSTETTFDESDWRCSHPAFHGKAFDDNLAIVDTLREIATDCGATLSQLAIAWTLANPAVDVAIVGSRRAEHVVDSVGAAELELDADTIAYLRDTAGRGTHIDVLTPESE